MRRFLHVLALLCPAIAALAAGPAAHGTPALKRAYDTEGKAVLGAFAPVAARGRGSVVRLLVDGRPAALGTVVDAGGLVLTKASELDPPLGDKEDRPPAAPTLSARRRGGEPVRAWKIAVDRRHDLALVRVDIRGLVPVSWAEPDAARTGRWVVVPGLEDLPEAVGVYSAPRREVHGVRLGISFGQSEAGPVIGATIPGMGAAEAGLRRGDVIRGINGKPTPTADLVIDRLRGVNAGDVVPVLIERNGKTRRVPVEMRLRKLDPNSRVDHINTMGNDVSHRRDGFPAVFQHDALIAPGQCGGPVLDLEGKALGINIARAGRVEAFAIPADVVVEVLEKLHPNPAVRGPAGADSDETTR